MEHEALPQDTWKEIQRQELAQEETPALEITILSCSFAKGAGGVISHTLGMTKARHQVNQDNMVPRMVERDPEEQ